MNLTLLQAAQLGTLTAVALTLSGCAALQGVFKAGVWVGLVSVLFLVGGVAILSGVLQH